MRTKTHFLVVTCMTVALGCLSTLFGGQQARAELKGVDYLAGAQTGNPGLKSIGRMSFGPSGLLLVADPAGAAVVAIDTGDTGPLVKLKKRIDNVNNLIATSMKAKPEGVKIEDMVVNPKSGKVYLSVRRQQDNHFAILTVDTDGKINPLDLEKSRYVRVTLPAAKNAKLRNINSVAFAEDGVLATGQCTDELANKIYSIPFPLEHGAKANIYSAEVYHISHRRWETKTPIQSFIPFEKDGEHYLVGGFGCTPLVRFPLDELKSGDSVLGASIIELGSGNRPLDMFTYQKDGRNWLVTNTFRFHFKKNLFGPSKWWGVRVDMGYISTDKINENAVRRDTKNKTGPDGVEIMDVLFGVVQVDKLNDDEIMVLRDRDDSGKLDLELAKLP